MDRNEGLPDRCILCNAPAAGYRLRRKLHYSPVAWQICAFAAPVAAVALGRYLDNEMLLGSLLPLFVLVLIAHLFVRKALKVEFGICPRHRRLNNALITLSGVSLIAIAIAILFIIEGAGGSAVSVLLGSLAALVALLGAQPYVSPQAIRLADLSPDHAWLLGTGAAFRNALPELP